MKKITFEVIEESERLKKEMCESCMEDLKGIFTKEQLQRFEDVFYSNMVGRIFERKEVKCDETI